MISLAHLGLLQKGMHMGIFRQQHNAEGIPIQPGHRMEGAFLARLLIVTHHKIGQRSVEFAPGRVDQHSRRLVHRQNMFVLIQNRQRTFLRRVFGIRLFQRYCDHVPRFHRIIRMLRLAVDKDLILPLQPVHQTGGNLHILLQNRR